MPNLKSAKFFRRNQKKKNKKIKRIKKKTQTGGRCTKGDQKIISSGELKTTTHLSRPNTYTHSALSEESSQW